MGSSLTSRDPTAWRALNPRNLGDLDASVTSACGLGAGGRPSDRGEGPIRRAPPTLSLDGNGNRPRVVRPAQVRSFPSGSLIVSRSQRKRKNQALRSRPTLPPAAVTAASIMASVTMAAGAPAPVLPAAAGRPPGTATGPKTPEGKLNSRKTALKHGLTAKTVILPGEDPDQIHARAERWRQTYNPVGAAEEELVDQIALASLRLKRITRAENAAVAIQFNKRRAPLGPQARHATPQVSTSARPRSHHRHIETANLRRRCFLASEMLEEA